MKVFGLVTTVVLIVVMIPVGWIGSAIADGDIWNGWGAGAGSPYGTQARLALEFCQTVAGGSTVDPRTANIALTGHSLGAGLAGLAGGSLHGHRFCGDSLRQRLLGLSEPGQDDRHPQAAFRAVREDDFAAM